MYQSMVSLSNDSFTNLTSKTQKDLTLENTRATINPGQKVGLVGKRLW